MSIAYSQSGAKYRRRKTMRFPTPYAKFTKFNACELFLCEYYEKLIFLQFLD